MLLKFTDQGHLEHPGIDEVVGGSVVLLVFLQVAAQRCLSYSTLVDGDSGVSIVGDLKLILPNLKKHF
jgi:hypothetical protein